jgi:RNA polymerase sigma-70 factor (ECF subfamily)
VVAPTIDGRASANRQLVERARRGDRAAFQEVATGIGPALERFLVRRLRLDADTACDIVQDTLFTAWRNMDRIRDADHLRPWLFRVARYKAITWMRRRGPRGATMDSLDVDRESGREATHGQMAHRAGARAAAPESATRARERLEARAALSRLVGMNAGAEAPREAASIGPKPKEDDVLRRLLHAALPGLRANYVAVVRLHYLYGHDTSVIAGLLGLRATTVKMRLHRARRQLRTLVREAAADLDPATRSGVLARLSAAETRRTKRR